MNLDKLFDHGKTMAKEVFDKDGMLHPCWIIETANGDVLPLVVPQGAMGNKEQVAAGVAQTMMQCNAIRYVCILEAWCVIGQSEREMKEVMANMDEVPIREHPKRIEVVHIMAEDKHHVMSGHYRIMRPKNGKPYLSKFKIEENDHAEGRFCNLLADGTAIN